jgi:hypothetical protein
VTGEVPLIERAELVRVWPGEPGHVLTRQSLTSLATCVSRLEQWRGHQVERPAGRSLHRLAASKTSVRLILRFCQVACLFVIFGPARGSGSNSDAVDSTRVDSWTALRAKLPKFNEVNVDLPKLSLPPPIFIKPKEVNVEPELPASMKEALVDQDHAIMLPTFMINEWKPESRRRLPRIQIPEALKEVDLNPFLTDAGRGAALVEKHLTRFDRFVLNRFTFLGVTKESRARDAERVEQSAINLNQTADAIEVMESTGVNPKEATFLRDEYYKLMINRPKQ